MGFIKWNRFIGICKIKLIMKWFLESNRPKGKDFSEVTNKQIKWIENKLNNRPRKRLGYLTPNEKFKQIINQNSVAFAS